MWPDLGLTAGIRVGSIVWCCPVGKQLVVKKEVERKK
jgi:predicted metal-binding transcription factor (methanogenesis marker protein 9)